MLETRLTNMFASFRESELTEQSIETASRQPACVFISFWQLRFALPTSRYSFSALVSLLVVCFVLTYAEVRTLQ